MDESHNTGMRAKGVRCMLMRGGTSKGAYFLASDLPSDVSARDDLLLRIMGSPDPKQIDGIGGAHPLTSKVAIVSKSTDNAADVDFLFAQVAVEKGSVDTTPNCGNILAGIDHRVRGSVSCRQAHLAIRPARIPAHGQGLLDEGGTPARQALGPTIRPRTEGDAQATHGLLARGGHKHGPAVAVDVQAAVAPGGAEAGTSGWEPGQY